MARSFQRTKLRLIGNRGFTAMNRPNFVSWRHPVAAGVTIKSGQVISAKRNTVSGKTEWVLGYDPATSARHMIAFALDDSDDADVLAAGNLVGVPCVPEYGIQTGYIKDAVTFIEGDEVRSACIRNLRTFSPTRFFLGTSIAPTSELDRRDSERCLCSAIGAKNQTRPMSESPRRPLSFPAVPISFMLLLVLCAGFWWWWNSNPAGSYSTAPPHGPLGSGIMEPFRTPGGTLQTNGITKTEEIRKDKNTDSFWGTTTAGIRFNATYRYEVELRSDWSLHIDEQRRLAFVIAPAFKPQLPVAVDFLP